MQDASQIRMLGDNLQHPVLVLLRRACVDGGAHVESTRAVVCHRCVCVDSVLTGACMQDASQIRMLDAINIL